MAKHRWRLKTNRRGTRVRKTGETVNVKSCSIYTLFSLYHTMSFNRQLASKFALKHLCFSSTMFSEMRRCERQGKQNPLSKVGL